MADRFPLILNTSANQIQEIPSGDTLDVSDATIKTNLVSTKSVVGTGVSIVGVVTATSYVGSGAALTGIDITAVKDSGGNVKIQAQDSGAIYTGIHTFGSTTSFTSGVFNGTVTSTGAVVNGDIDLNGDIDVDGHTNLDNVSVGGATTFTGAIDANGDLDVDGHTNLDNVSIAGVTTHADNASVKFGTDADFSINHSGSSLGIVNTTGDALLRNTGGSLYFDCNQISLRISAGSQTMLNAAPGGVTLYTSNSSKLATSSTGVSLPQDLDVDGHTNLDNVSVAGVTTFAGAINGSSAAFTGNVSVAGTLTYEDVKNVDSVGVATARTGLKVLAGGANVVGVVTASNGIFVPDSQTIHVGGSSGSGDLQIYHDTSNSYIKDNGVGDLLLQTQAGYVKIRYGTDTMALFQPSNKAELYFANSPKLATSNTGVTITGNATATTFIGALTGTASGNAVLTGSTNNTICTVTGANAIQGESGLTYDGTALAVGNNSATIPLTIRKYDTSNTLHYIATFGGANHLTGYAVAIGLNPEGNSARDKIAIAAEGTSQGYSRGKLHFLVDAANDNNPATLAESRMTILDDGKVLIGHTSSISVGGHNPQFQIGGTSYHTSTMSLTNNANDSNGAYLMLNKQRSGSVGGNTIVQSGDEVGVVRFNAADGNDMAHRVAEIRANVDGTPGTNDMPGRLQFFTTGDGGTTSSVRMTIKNTGRVGINESDPSEMLYVAGNIYATGNVTAYSDIRVKENVKEISNALEAVDKIRGVSYTRKDTKEDTLGVSAQEVESMFPELVVEDNHGMKSVNYNGLVGVLFSAVKELSTKLKEIEDK